MDLLKNNYLRIPLLLLVLIFAIDKIAFIPKVKNSIMHWKKIEPLLYESREGLFEQLKEDYVIRKAKNKRLGLILGSSRSSEFGTENIAKYINDSYTYNFSAPFTSISYYYFWLDRLLQEKIVPKFVILEIDATVFAPHAINYQLSYSFNMDFVFRHTDINRPRLNNPWNQVGKGFSVADADKYFLKQLFGFYKYPLSISNIKENSRKQIMPMPDGKILEIQIGDWREHAKPLIVAVNKKELGGIPNFFFVTLPADQLKKDIENTARRDLANYRASPTQVVFFKRLLQRLAEHKIPALIYVPFVNPLLHKYVQKKDKVYNIQNHFFDPLYALLKKSRKKNGTVLHVVNVNGTKKMKCQKFTDAYHLSGQCFPELTRHLLKDFSRMVE